MLFYVIKNHCITGKLSEDEVDFLEREHIRTMSSISEIIYPSIANINICEACNLEPGSFWIICNASILDRIRPVKTGKQRVHNYLMHFVNINFLSPRPDLQE